MTSEVEEEASFIVKRCYQRSEEDKEETRREVGGVVAGRKGGQGRKRREVKGGDT